MSKKPKMVICIRTDIGMTAGKAAAQAGHGVAELMLGARPEGFNDWLSSGMKKVVLQIDSEAKFDDIVIKAIRAGIPVVAIADAGLTQLDPGTKTVVALGPATEQKMKKVVGSLKLYE